MANIIEREVIVDGPSKATIKWAFESDGNEGELNNYVLLDPRTDFVVPIPYQLDQDGNKKPLQLSILQAWFSGAWFDIELLFNGTVPRRCFTIARDAQFYFDFRYFRGLKDDTVVDPTGELLITTRDFAPLGSSGFLVLEVLKN